MGDFSDDPDKVLKHAQEQGYVGLRIEQGVPILDRDLNLIQDLIAAQVRLVFARYIGDGLAPDSDAFAIREIPVEQGAKTPENDFLIEGPGNLLVQGIEVTTSKPCLFSEQSEDKLTTPTSARRDLVYLDMFLTEVNGTDDLNNAADVGMQTSVRIRCDWKVHVAEGQPAPPRPTDGHAFVPLARIIRQKDDPVIRTEMLSDVRQRRLSVADLEQRMSVVEALRLQPSFADPGFSPSNGIAGQQITLNGRNFDVKDLAVDFGGAKARILDSSPASAVVEVPQGLTPNGSATGVTISVSSLGGTATTSRAFTVRATPQFGDIGQQIQPPKAAIGSDVTLLGHNFKGSGLAVTLGDQSADVVGKPDNTALVVKVPSGLQIGAEVAAKVQTDEGTVLSQDKIKIIPPAPTLEANPFVPSTQSRGQTFKIKGKNLISPMTVIFVKFNREVDGDPLPEGNTAIVKVPDDLTETGATKIDVKTAGGSVRSAIDFTVQS